MTARKPGPAIGPAAWPPERLPEALHALAWPADRLAEALHALAKASGLLQPDAGVGPAPLGPAPRSAAALAAWLAAAAGSLGLEVETLAVEYASAGQLVAGCAPAVVELRDATDPAAGRFLALVRGGRRRVHALGPDGRVHPLPAGAVRDCLCAELEAALAPEIDELLQLSGAPGRPRARAALLRERLGRDRTGRRCFSLDLPPGSPFRRQLRRAGLWPLLGRLAGAHGVQTLLLLAGWWVLGRGALQGRLDRGWLLAWALLLLTIVPFRAVELWSAGRLANRVGWLLKRRLMAGVLQLEPEEVRHQGTGQLLGKVLNSEALEVLVVSGAHQGLMALVEVLLALPVLALGAGGWPHALLLLAWSVAAALFGYGYLVRRRRWTGARLAMTHDLVEQMEGHRTRLVQQRAGALHDEEDRALEAYLDLAAAMDRRSALARVVVPRGWMLLSLASIAWPFAAGGLAPAAVAVSVGGTLLAYQALAKLTQGLADLAEAAVSWQQVRPLFLAAGRAEAPAAAARAAAARRGPEDGLLECRDLGFRYADRSEPVLRGCNLSVRPGDRLLLEGPSGGGKSTLAAVLAGLRAPSSGLLLLDGLDRGTLGTAPWRRRVAVAPQSQENHVLLETFAFNLLLGRGWPPGAADLDEAAAVCRELGLGDLLDRMPSGLQQLVGESGWQLSAGERSRLYVARALLQGSDLVLLDESLAGLDPWSLRCALRCALARVPTLLVIAHP